MATSVLPGVAPAAEITPFNTFNQSPLVQIFGLPSPGNARILERGRQRGAFLFDLANNWAGDATDREEILLDGESIRGTFGYSRGFARYEAGVEIPVVSQSGGFADGFVEGWHSFFQLPNEGRPSAPRNRLLYVYSKDGVERFRYTRSKVGIGDVRFSGGTQLLAGENGAVALRGMLKVPTGDSSGLLGSGSTDFALWCTGQRDFRGTHTAIFGAIGAMAMTTGDVLADQQRNLVGFGSIGAGWSPWRPVAFKVQFSSHTPFYRGSDLPELSGASTLVLMGGTVAISPSTALDIGVSEDIAVDRSPDVALHLGLTTNF